MKIALVRHGECWSGEPPPDEVCPADRDIGLTAIGQRQIEDAASRIRTMLREPRVFASGSRRAFESASIVARHFRTDISTWPELREVVALDGTKTHRDLCVVYDQFRRDFYSGTDTNDLVASSREKIDTLLGRIIAEWRDESDIILVGHGGVFELLLSKLFGTRPSLAYTIEFALQPGSFHLLDLNCSNGAIHRVRMLAANTGFGDS